jgi:hypothetical protein
MFPPLSSKALLHIEWCACDVGHVYALDTPCMRCTRVSRSFPGRSDAGRMKNAEGVFTTSSLYTSNLLSVNASAGQFLSITEWLILGPPHR